MLPRWPALIAGTLIVVVSAIGGALVAESSLHVVGFTALAALGPAVVIVDVWSRHVG